ncbi:hypothetical protein [Enterovibrio baiacu]|uniref:hypothetical protein n=1 Tax=Enterovibrio baiacu TaxID=2491023 RepID=UPI001013583A|nr:hypothetical protein [Enterovibrio baiacu]MBE1275644.1 hypothetical protein [Enterovibrio baiacu]
MKRNIAVFLLFGYLYYFLFHDVSRAEAVVSKLTDYEDPKEYCILKTEKVDGEFHIYMMISMEVEGIDAENIWDAHDPLRDASRYVKDAIETELNSAFINMDTRLYIKNKVNELYIYTYRSEKGPDEEGLIAKSWNDKDLSPKEMAYYVGEHAVKD